MAQVMICKTQNEYEYDAMLLSRDVSIRGKPNLS